METPLQVMIMSFILERFATLPSDRYRLFSRYYDAIYERELGKRNHLSRRLSEHQVDVNHIHERVSLILQSRAEMSGEANVHRREEWRAQKTRASALSSFSLMECVMTNQPARPFVRNFPTVVAETGRIEPAPRRVRGNLNGRTVFDTTRAQYVWEWPNYPQYYVPVEDVTQHFLFGERRPQKLHLGTAARHGAPRR